MLYDTFIFPIQTLMKFILEGSNQLINNWGVSICVLSIIVSILMLPLQKIADYFKNKEDALQDSMKDELDLIKRRFTGIKRHSFIQNVYRRYHYSPIYSLRASLGLLILIPFFYSAYDLLVKLPALKDASFLFINNLAQPDHALFGINILPILMLIFSILNAWVTSYFSKKHNNVKSLLILNAIFFVLLYNAPAGAVLYWTMNNAVAIIKQIIIGLLRPKSENIISKTKASKSLTILKPTFATLKKICEQPFALLIIVMFWSLYKTYYLNWYIISFSELVESLAWLTGLASLGVLFLTCALWIFKLLLPNKSKKKKSALFSKLFVQASLFAALMSFVVLNYKLIYSIIPFPEFFDLKPIKRVLLIMIIGAVCCLLLTFIFRNKKNKISMALSFFFIAIISLNTINLLAQVACQKDYLSFNNKTKVDLDSIKFKHKPNVYFLVLESYHSPSFLKKTYNIDIDKFCNFLNKNKFQISDNTWSNYTTTLPSLQGIFTMKHHKYQTQIGADNIASRGILSGQFTNNVYKVFQNNRYHINAFWPDSMTYRFPGNIRNRYKGKFYYENDMRNKFNSPAIFPETIMLFKFTSMFIDKLAAKHQVTSTKSTTQKIKSLINNFSKEKQPQFTTIKLTGLEHSPNFISYTTAAGKKRLDNFAHKTYPGQIKKYTKELEDIISLIKAKDPNAVIILSGDHGAYKYRGLHTIAFDKPLKLSKITKNISKKRLINDITSVFYATYYPENLTHPKSPVTNIQIFPQLFRALSENNNLDFSIPDISYYEGENKKIYKIENIDSPNPKTEIFNKTP